MSKEIKGYCDLKCCKGKCYLETNIKLLAEKYHIEYLTADTNTINRYGLDKSPSILILKNNSKLKLFKGKLLDGKISDFLTSVGW